MTAAAPLASALLFVTLWIGHAAGETTPPTPGRPGPAVGGPWALPIRSAVCLPCAHILRASLCHAADWAHSRGDNSSDSGQTRSRRWRPLGSAHPLRSLSPLCAYPPRFSLSRCGLGAQPGRQLLRLRADPVPPLAAPGLCPSAPQSVSPVRISSALLFRSGASR